MDPHMRGQIFNLYHVEDGEGVSKSGFNSLSIKNTIELSLIHI